jgi:hypothetical protein
VTFNEKIGSIDRSANRGIFEDIPGIFTLTAAEGVEALLKDWHVQIRPERNSDGLYSTLLLTVPNSITAPVTGGAETESSSQALAREQVAGTAIFFIWNDGTSCVRLRQLPRQWRDKAGENLEKAGDPGVIRTRGLRFRKPLLYPAELRGRLGRMITGSGAQR